MKQLILPQKYLSIIKFKEGFNQKYNEKDYLKSFFMFVMLLFLYSCSHDELRETEQTQNSFETDLRVQYKRGSQVSSFAINYIKEKTNNTFAVSSKKDKVTLISSTALSKNDALGTVDTSKEIVVVNETNTKHTFKVITPDESLNTITNLIIVEKGDNSYEYFLKYTFMGELPLNDYGTIDFSKFNGTIETFNANGDLIGSMTIENGTITNNQGQLSPCPDDTQNTSDGTNTGTGGSDSSTGVPGGNDEEPNNTGNGDPSTSTQFTDVDGDCGLTWSYEPCGCGGDANGHSPQQGVSCCQGSPLVIRDCNGTIIAQRNTGDATTIFKRDITDPCDDGDVGVILTDDELCEMSDESFNAYYSSKSPFNVDLSDVRNACDTIGLPKPENEKFMCVYNKLVNSPTFKNLFTDIFGENININAKFLIVDAPSATNSNTNGTCQATGNYDSNGNLINIVMTIKIKKFHIESDARISVAKTILHECIHAYLKMKKVDSSQGTALGDINNEQLSELINQYENNEQFNSGQNGHEFMFDYMLPSMQQMLSDVRDNLIPQNHRQIVEAKNYQSPSNPVVPSHPWNWNEFYYYFSLRGLHNTDAFANQIANDSIKNYLYNRYNLDGEQLSSTYCQN